MYNSREEIGELIYNKLQEKKEFLTQQFMKNDEPINYFYLDELLPKKVALKIYESFPLLSEAVQRKNIREYKYIAYQMNKYNPFLEEVIYAFQEKKVVQMISEICGFDEKIVSDKNLYAGGLSMMKKDCFLNPHLDNSHDKNRNLWRVLNLLFYVTPDWKIENGGNLELWEKGLKNDQITIESKFNRLVVMITHSKSWHSVSKVNANKVRCCVSNYYFSEVPALVTDTFHVTTFRGKTNNKIKNLLLFVDSELRNKIRFFFKNGIRENPHRYKK